MLVSLTVKVSVVTMHLTMLFGSYEYNILMQFIKTIAFLVKLKEFLLGI